MESSMQVKEINIISQPNDELKIVGAQSDAEARDAVEQWCEENNSLLQEIRQSREQFKSNDDSHIVFYAKVYRTWRP